MNINDIFVIFAMVGCIGILVGLFFFGKAIIYFNQKSKKLEQFIQSFPEEMSDLRTELKIMMELKLAE